MRRLPIVLGCALLLVVATLGFEAGPVRTPQDVAVAQVEVTPTTEAGRANNTAASSEEQVEAVFIRMTWVIAPIVALVLVVVVVWHRRSLQRR